ncbi:MAG: zf-HC2 domain-containing protein [Acidobacteriota bacterium]|jgi:Putative zinc-finger|nr:zf-HC2 domain-containing protein [Acidobacteriota bacterium]
MTTPCEVHASGAIELYFYDELTPREREAVESHVLSCGHCRTVLAELGVIRDALAQRPVVSGPASGNWSAFMSRLDASLAGERLPVGNMVAFARASRRTYVGYVAMAALLTLVTLSVAIAIRSRAVPAPAVTGNVAPRTAAREPTDTAAFTALSEEHFERSKLVVLGLATKDPQRGAADWRYERELATSLLNDTRMYRLAAEDRGLTSLAGVMRDLELVLLQTSLTDDKDPASLPQLQRLIQKRDLLEKMDVVTTTTGL